MSQRVDERSEEREGHKGPIAEPETPPFFTVTASEAQMQDRATALPIRLVLSDVDGVMTGGELIYGTDAAGDLKAFHVRDGMGIKIWQAAGFGFGIVSSRDSPAVRRRASELGIEHLVQGADLKLPAVMQLVQSLGLKPAETAYIGDDLPDLAVMRFVGLAVAPADACSDVLSLAHWVTRSPGGRGVVREVIERLMRANGIWEKYALA